ncbi:MAG: HPr family phosphocarrier protein [Parvularculaceae bacterium]
MGGSDLIPDRPTKPTTKPGSRVVKEVEVGNRRGLHARAAAKFCALAGALDATVRVRKDDLEVGGCSIMGLLLLGAGLGSRIAIVVEAEDDAAATAACGVLVDLVESRFGEDA